MKNWKKAEIVELSIDATASGDCHTGTEWNGSNFEYPGGTHDSAHCDHGYPDKGWVNFMEGVTAGKFCDGVAVEGNS